MTRSTKTSLVQVVRDPLLPWKTSIEVFRRARSLGMEVVVALDGRSQNGSLDAVRAVAHRVFVFDTDDVWPEGQLNRLLDEATREWAFLVSDDEMPSDELWDFATKIPTVTNNGRPYLWRPHMLAPLPDRPAHYKPLDTYQPRYFPRTGIAWPGGFDETPRSLLEEIDFDLVLWHYTLWSPREYRERKVREHEEAWQLHWAAHPWLPESRKAYLWEDYPEQYVTLGMLEEHRPRPVAHTLG